MTGPMTGPMTAEPILATRAGWEAAGARVAWDSRNTPEGLAERDRMTRQIAAARPRPGAARFAAHDATRPGRVELLGEPTFGAAIPDSDGIVVRCHCGHDDETLFGLDVDGDTATCPACGEVYTATAHYSWTVSRDAGGPWDSIDLTYGADAR